VASLCEIPTSCWLHAMIQSNGFPYQARKGNNTWKGFVTAWIMGMTQIMDKWVRWSQHSAVSLDEVQWRVPDGLSMQSFGVLQLSLGKTAPPRVSIDSLIFNSRERRERWRLLWFIFRFFWHGIVFFVYGIVDSVRQGIFIWDRKRKVEGIGSSRRYSNKDSRSSRIIVLIDTGLNFGNHSWIWQRFTSSSFISVV